MPSTSSSKSDASTASTSSTPSSVYSNWCDSQTELRVKSWKNKASEEYTFYPFNPASKSDDSHPLHWYLSELCKKYDTNGFPDLCVGFIENGEFYSPKQYHDELVNGPGYDEEILGEILLNLDSDNLPDNPCPFDMHKLNLDEYSSVGWIILKGNPDSSSHDYSCIVSENVTDSYTVALSKYRCIQLKDSRYDDNMIAHYRHFYIGEEMHYTLYNDD